MESKHLIAEPPRPLIAAHGVTVTFDRERVLDNVDISVAKGEIVTLIGLNGSGKTTLVRVLLGLIKPAVGSVDRVPGLTIGYAPQSLPLDRTMPLTVERFLLLGSRQGRDRLAEVLNEVGMPPVLDRQMSALSGGQTHRVLLARALLRNPNLLILDEPMSGVDIAGQAELYDLLVRVRDARGCGLLIVSHDLSLVMSATDSVVCLNRHVCCRGQPHTVVNHPAFVDLFGAEVSRSLAVYHHQHDHRHDLSNRAKADTTAVPEDAGHG